MSRFLKALGIVIAVAGAWFWGAADCLAGHPVVRRVVQVRVAPAVQVQRVVVEPVRVVEQVVVEPVTVERVVVPVRQRVVLRQVGGCY